MKSRRRQNAINRLRLEPLERRVLLSGLTVSLPSSMTTYQGGELAVPITVAQLTDGTGDTGLSSAGICINYNSSDFTVADVKQGTAGQEASSLLSVTSSGTAGALKVSIAEQTMEIASISAPGNGPVTITAKEALPAGYSGAASLAVQLSGIVGLSGANGVWSISVTGTKTFTLDNSSSLSGIAEADQGTFGAVIQGGAAGTAGGANNASIAVVDFLAKTNAATGSTPITLVASNSAGVAFFTAADGVGYNASIISGSVNILASASAPKLGSFAAITPLSTLTGTANDPGIGVMLDLPNGDIMANGGDDGTSNQWFLLTPDASGNYADGTWSALASSNIGRNSFGSAVLNNGQVMILGGEGTNIGGSIASVVGTKTTPITVTMVNPLPTDLTSGNVTISNVAGFSFVNQSFDFTVTGPKTFTLNGTTDTVGSATPNTGKISVSETDTGEIFTPPTTAGGTGTWQNITSFPLAEFGDGNIEVMNNGTVLAGYFGAFGDPDTGQTYRYNEALDPLVTPSAPKGSDPWSLDATLPAGDSNSEATWNKLPDGSIVSANIGPNSNESPQTATRLVFGATQAQDQWVSAGAIPVPLGATGGLEEIQEMGPAVLLPNGTLFQIGSSGNTALYTPPALAGNSTGTWVAGPVIPGGYAPTDAPGAMMNNGDVLFAAAPYLQNGAGDGGYNNSTELFEYNPTTNIIRQVPPDNSSGTAIADLTSTLASNYCFEMRMLDLPNGQVMFSDGSGNAYVYTANSSPNGVATPLAAWQPTISNITPLPFTPEFVLSGTQLNGISEGASYGDDAQMASNYPLVRLQSSSGTISYATSLSWSSDGVATGATTETAVFALPTGDAPGAYLVSVVANGIASNSALVVFMGGASSASVVTDPNNSAEVDVDLAGKSAEPFTLPSTTTQVIVVGANDSQSITINDNLGSGNVTVNTDEISPSDTETVDIQQTGAGSTLLFGGAGNDTYDIGGTTQNLNAIAGEVVILSGTGSTNVTADDTYNGSTSTYTVLDGTVERAGFGGLFIEGNYQSLSLIAGYAPENVNVVETPAGSTLDLNGGGGDDTVDIGSTGIGLGDIQGPIDVSNTPYYSQITLNDAGDPTAHSNVSINNGSIVGLAPAKIDYTTVTNDVNSLTIDGNSASDKYNIDGGSTLTPVTINPGAGTDQVNFESNLSGTFTVNGAGSNTTVAVTDAASTPQTYTVTSTGLTVTGFTLSVSSIDSLTLTAGSTMNNVVNIDGTAAGTPLTINAGSGSTMINVTQTNATGPVIINSSVGDNTIQLSTPTLATNLSGIAGAVDIDAGTGSTSVYAYDDEMGSTATYSIYDGVVLRAGFGGLFISGSYQSLYLTVGYAPENVNVIETPAGSTLNLNGAGGDDTVDIGSTGIGLGEIQGPINVSNSAYYTQLTLNDAGDTASHAAVSVTNGSVTGLSPAAINWTVNDPAGVDVNSVTIDGNSASDTYDIVGGNSSTPVTINTGAGADQVNFESSLSGAFTINGAGSNTTVSVADGASTPQTYTITSTGLTVSGFTLNVSSIGLLILHPGGAANNVVDIESLPCVFDSDGSAGSVNYVVSNGGVTPSLAHRMLLEGGSDGGTLTFDDSLGTDTSEPVVASTSVTDGGAVCGYLDISYITLDTGTDEGIPVNINSTAAGTPVTVNAGPGATIIDANQTSPTGPVIIGPGAGFTTANVSTTGLGATVEFQATQQIVALTIGTGGMVVIAGSSPITLTTDSLTIAAAATLDITSSTLAIDFTPGSDPISTIQSYVKTGYKNDTWTGHGIVSSNAAADPGLYAVGYVDGNLDAGTPAAANQILIKNTLAGDANLDGVVNFADLLAVAQNFNHTLDTHGNPIDWSDGDFNYDGKVNFADLLLVAQNFNKHLAAGQSAQTPDSTGTAAAPAANEASPATSAAKTLVHCHSSK
jgi:hypothetical protein